MIRKTFLKPTTKHQKTYAWLVHLLTATGAVFGLFAILNSIWAKEAYILRDVAGYIYYIKTSIFFIFITIFIDAIDGFFARRVDIKNVVPFDGALLDNIIDFLNYSVIPCIWLYTMNIVSGSVLLLCIILIMLASCYQFCQLNAKSEDHFFVGFPSYWNLLVVALFCLNTSFTFNFIIIVIFSILSFVPIKYMYLSRPKNISSSLIIRILILTYTIISAIFAILMVIIWPRNIPDFMRYFIYSYIIFYFLYSIYLNLFPMRK